MKSNVPSGRYWEPQPETIEDEKAAYEAYLEKLKAEGKTDEVPELPFV